MEESRRERLVPQAAWEIMAAMLSWIEEYEKALWAAVEGGSLERLRVEWYSDFPEVLYRDELRPTAVLRLDLPELKKVAVNLAKEHGVALPLFYGQKVPYNDANLLIVQTYCDIIEETYDNANAIKGVFEKANKILDNYLPDLKHLYRTSDCYYWYSYRNKEREFALTPEGIELCHKFVTECYKSEEEALKKKEAEMSNVAEKAEHKVELTLDQKWVLKQGLVAMNLAVSGKLERAFMRNQDDWAEIIRDMRFPVPEANQQTGDAKYSLWQFKKMLLEKNAKESSNEGEN